MNTPDSRGDTTDAPVPPDALAGCSLFFGMPADVRAVLSRYFTRVEAEAGSIVVREGEPSDTLFVLLAGRARLERHRVQLVPVGPGAVIGELGLITGRHRASTATALEPLVLAALDRPRYEAMRVEHPAEATRLLEAIVGVMGRRLVEMTDSVGVLLAERSLPRRASVNIVVGGEKREVPTGTLAGALLPSTVRDAPVVAALLDRRAVSLATPLVSDAKLEPLTTEHQEGREVFRHSAGLVVLEAVHHVDHGLAGRLGGTLGGAQALELTGPLASDPDVLERLNAAIGDLIRADVPIRTEAWDVSEAREHLVRQGWSDAARLLEGSRTSRVSLVSCGAVYAPAPGPLVLRTGQVAGIAVVASPTGPRVEFGADMRRHLPRGGQDEEQGPPPDDAEMARAHRKWLGGVGIESVGDFNVACVAGRTNELVRVAEGFHEKRLSDIADQIVAASPRVRVVCIAGPSSSGKTTFIKRLNVQLQVNGLRPTALSLDDYYVDRERTPRDEAGDYDFEAFEALDSDLLQRQIGELLAGGTVKTARYDFKAGRSLVDGGHSLSLGGDGVLLLEGIHGLNPRLLASIPPDVIFRVFIHPATALPADRLSPGSTVDLRLLRRIVRDRHQRGYSAADTIDRWPSVRRGERLHIFPFLLKADVVFDSALAYELAVLKVFADRYLLEVPHDHPAYTTAFRLRMLLDRYVTLYPDQVPPTSILREFIGGSGFEY